MPEYPAIAKQIRAVKLAPHGCKGAKLRKLVKMRLASLKRELSALRLRSLSKSGQLKSPGRGHA